MRHLAWVISSIALLQVAHGEQLRREDNRPDSQRELTKRQPSFNRYFTVAVGIHLPDDDQREEVVQCSKRELDKLQDKINLILYSTGVELKRQPMFTDMIAVPNLIEAGVCASERNHQRRQLWEGEFVYFGGGHTNFYTDNGKETENGNEITSSSSLEVEALSKIYLAQLKLSLKDQIGQAIKDKAMCIGESFITGIKVEPTTEEKFGQLKDCVEKGREAVQSMFGSST